MPRNTFHSLLALTLGLLLLAPACKSEKKAAAPDKNTASPGETAAVEQAPAPAVEVDESAFIAKPFFYKVEGPDGAGGHLLGTMHMGIDATKELPPIVWTVLSEASVLAIEADISDPDLSKGMMLPEGENLRNLLGEETWKLLEEKLGSTMAKMMMPMKPAAAAATLAMQGLPITMPMEMIMITKAKEATIDLDYLESATFQLGILNQVMDAEFLTHMLKNPEAQDSSKLLPIYREGDEEALLEAMLDPEAWGTKAEANIDLLIYKRNDDWIPKLEGLFAKKNAFVGVGAAHLVGPRGVLASLKAKGYTVERISK